MNDLNKGNELVLYYDSESPLEVITHEQPRLKLEIRRQLEMKQLVKWGKHAPCNGCLHT